MVERDGGKGRERWITKGMVVLLCTEASTPGKLQALICISQLSEADVAKQAQLAAMNIGGTVTSTLQTGSRNATEAFSRFVEGDEHRPHNTNATRNQPDEDKRDFWDSFAEAGEVRAQAKKKPVEPERKDFWDEFAEVGAARSRAQNTALAPKSKSSIGTAAMRKPNASGGGAAGASKEDEWGEW